MVWQHLTFGEIFPQLTTSVLSLLVIYNFQ